MGACSKFMTLRGDLTKTQVMDRFYERQEDDREEYGNDPYNGSWTTFEDIEFIGGVWKDGPQAERYILDHAEKWGNALAVQVQEENKCFWLIGGWAAE